MSAGRDDKKPDKPVTPEGAPPSSPASRLTSRDIFGDILDTLEGTPAPTAAPTAPVRQGPIKVQVSESVAKRETGWTPGPPPEGVLPEDIARLLDAFSEPAEAAARAEVVDPAEPPVAVEPEPVTSAEAVQPETDVAELFEDAERLLGRDRHGHSGPQSREALDDLVQLRMPQDLRQQGEAAGRGPEPGRLATRFQAVAAKEPSGGGLDLAALAEDALRAADAAAGRRPVEPPASDVYGPYRLLKREAMGGMAEVWRAKRSGVEGFEKVVAVKRILPHLSDNKEFVDMFIDEAKMVAGLAHPNIVQIFDLGRIDRSYYIAMEYVHGHDLRSILRRARERGMRLPLDLCVLIASRVCLALEFAHRKKDEAGRPVMIVHRDVSPQNILISFEGEVKLTDFGIAKAASKASLSDSGALRGKLLYMSPEQAWGKPLDKRSDVFSLGLVLYEMVTDQKPFLAASEMSILEMVRQCQIPPPSALNPRIPERLEAAILKALQREPDYRYQDAGEMYRDLERVLHERQPLPADALAHFMRTVFELEEKPAEPGPAPRPDRDLELAVQEDAPAAAMEPPAPAEPAAAQPAPTGRSSIQKLLRRFGLK